MVRIPGVSHQRAVKALERAGLRIARLGRHIVETDGRRILTDPRHDPVNAYTLGGIVRDLVGIGERGQAGVGAEDGVAEIVTAAEAAALGVAEGVWDEARVTGWEEEVGSRAGTGPS